MTRLTAVTAFLIVGAVIGCLGLNCACRIAILIGGRLGEAIRTGSPNAMAVGAFWLTGLVISSMLNILFGWCAVSGINGHAPDHAFYVMVSIIMFTLPFLAACLGMAFLAAMY